MKSLLRHILLISFYCSFSYISRAQSIFKIDQTQGYYGFKLGDNLDKWNSQLQQIVNVQEKKIFKYTSPSPIFFKNFEVNQLLLTFNKEKLVSIIIDLKTWDVPINDGFTDIENSINKFNALLSSNKLDFDEPSNIDKDINNGKITAFWEGNVNYALSKMSYLGVKKGSRATFEIGIKSYQLNNSN